MTREEMAMRSGLLWHAQGWGQDRARSLQIDDDFFRVLSLLCYFAIGRTSLSRKSIREIDTSVHMQALLSVIRGGVVKGMELSSQTHSTFSGGG